MKHIDVSIVLPSYNEEKIIKKSLRTLAAFVAKHHDELGRCEVIVVAAGDDKTAEIANAFSNDFDAFQVITPGARVGKGRDVRLGMQAARGDVQLFMDTDLSTPLHHVLPMVARLRAGADVVIGRRQLSRIHKGVRAVLSVASNFLIRLMLFPRFGDTQCGFKGFTASAAQTLFARQVAQGWGFDLEVLQYAKEAGHKVEQLPIPDWREQRQEDFRGERLGGAALTTLHDLAAVRCGAWGRSLAKHWRIVVLLAMAGSFSLSLWIGASQSVWFDEAYSIMLIQQSYSDLMALTVVDAHPPFYYILLKAWSSLFGTGELALRAFSALCMALAIGVALVLAKRLFGVRVVAVSALCLMLAPFLLRYGFEIRMYALAALICIAATLALVVAMQATSKKRQLAAWLGYAVLVAVGMYTLYYTVFIWIIHLIWLLYMMRRQVPKARLFSQPWMAALAASVILYTPWMPALVGQLTHSALSGVSRHITVYELVSVLSFSFIFKPHWELNTGLSLLVVLAFTGIIYLCVRVWRTLEEQKRPWFVLLMLYMVGPIAIMALGSLATAMFLERYMSHFVISGYLLVGVVLALALYARVRFAPVITAFLVAILIFGVANLNQTGNFTFERLMSPQAKQVAAQIGECEPGSSVLAGDPLLYFELHYYLPDCDLYFFNGAKPIGNRGGFAILHNSPQQFFEGQNLPGDTLYLVYTHEQSPLSVPSGFYQTESVNYQKFHLVTYQR